MEPKLCFPIRKEDHLPTKGGLKKENTKSQASQGLDDGKTHLWNGLSPGKRGGFSLETLTVRGCARLLELCAQSGGLRDNASQGTKLNCCGWKMVGNPWWVGDRFGMHFCQKLKCFKLVGVLSSISEHLGFSIASCQEYQKTGVNWLIQSTSTAERHGCGMAWTYFLRNSPKLIAVQKSMT